ncbi:Aminotransferase, class IV [Moelleriella libera RCEF 2490]|uniref:Aminotransferase, class IV n=1 Tax=Moelleriella libera RCEF 2490 TaxID=1081109 RepID=A0A168ENE8_9HYPO|nr:Aminotransferase, class IV [Moelleriella libera RCEF 2490]
MAADFSLFTSLRYDPELRQVPSKDIQFAGWNHHNESPLYMLDLHRDRLLRAAVHWKWEKAIKKLSGQAGIKNLTKAAEDAAASAQHGPLRIRIVVTQQGEISGESFNALPQDIVNLFPETFATPGSQPAVDQPQLPPRINCVVDSHGSYRSEHTHFKTTKRAVYDDARSRAGIGAINPADTTEVLIVNSEDDSVMEGSTTTPYFWQGGKWTTPPVSPRFSTHDGSGGNDGTTRRWALERGLAVEEAIKIDQLVEGEECYISNGVSGFRAGVVHLRKT